MAKNKKTLITVVALILASILSVHVTLALLHDKSETTVSAVSVADNA
jgi:hypothetical protein